VLKTTEVVLELERKLGKAPSGHKAAH
jgi:hypothetical protein